MELVDRIIVPRHSRPMGGIDHGNIGYCLVRQLDRDGSTLRQLVWFKGSRIPVGVRGFGSVYHQGSLNIINRNEYTEKDFHASTGRLSKALITLFSDPIDAAFGEGVSHAIDIRKTLLVTEFKL